MQLPTSLGPPCHEPSEHNGRYCLRFTVSVSTGLFVAPSSCRPVMASFALSGLSHRIAQRSVMVFPDTSRARSVVVTVPPGGLLAAWPTVAGNVCSAITAVVVPAELELFVASLDPPDPLAFDAVPPAGPPAVPPPPVHPDSAISTASATGTKTVRDRFDIVEKAPVRPWGVDARSLASISRAPSRTVGS